MQARRAPNPHSVEHNIALQSITCACRAPCPLSSRSPLSDSAVSVAVWRLGTAVVGILGGAMEMPCDFTPQMNQMEELVIYWQKQISNKDPAVITELVHGEINEAKQDPRFQGRVTTKLAAGSFTLHLRNLTLEDQGNYSCIIMLDHDVIKELHLTSTELKVTVPFSVPVVSRPADDPLDYGQEVTLTCAAHGGMEQPAVTWLNASDGADLNGDQNQNVTRRHGGTLNVAGTITFNITGPINITCVIQTPWENITSQPYELELRPPDISQSDSQSQSRTAVTAGVTVVLLLVAAAALLLLKGNIFCRKYKGKEHTGTGGNNPTPAESPPSSNTEHEPSLLTPPLRNPLPPPTQSTIRPF
uniref:Ig-like domain-containing protein n=1 Tax=Leptobrachium leishanense TaxID=445787 RepID=A0A8C5QLI6_9ANUR